MILSIRLIPNASRNEVVGWLDGALKIRVAAPAVDNKANEELLRFLAKQLDLPFSELHIIGGATSRNKKIKIPLTDQDVKTMIKI